MGKKKASVSGRGLLLSVLFDIFLAKCGNALLKDCWVKISSRSLYMLMITWHCAPSQWAFGRSYSQSVRHFYGMHLWINIYAGESFGGRNPLFRFKTSIFDWQHTLGLRTPLKKSCASIQLGPLQTGKKRHCNFVSRSLFDEIKSRWNGKQLPDTGQSTLESGNPTPDVDCRCTRPK